MVDLRKGDSIAEAIDKFPPGIWIIAVYNQNRADDEFLKLLPKPEGVSIEIINLLPMARQLYHRDQYVSRSLGYLYENIFQEALEWHTAIEDAIGLRNLMDHWANLMT